jgi:hypothetical protein
MEKACCQITTHSFAQKRIKWSKVVARAKHGFQCEKAAKQWCGPDATAKGQKIVIPPE